MMRIYTFIRVTLHGTLPCDRIDSGATATHNGTSAARSSTVQLPIGEQCAVVSEWLRELCTRPLYHANVLTLLAHCLLFCLVGAVAVCGQRYLLEGGWGIRRNNAKTLSNVAQKVGLQMPKETAHMHHEPAGNKHHKARDAKLHFHDKFEK